MKTVSLSVGEFALPSPLRGSIEAHSGFGRSQLGQEIHLRVQEGRKKEFPSYQAEVSVSHAFERGGFRFEIGGRIDGFFPEGKIEEIKSSFQVKDLARRLEEDSQHPYSLQLQTYGYFHWFQTGKLPDLSFCLVSTRDFSTLEVELDFDPADYELWLERRLAELVAEAKLAEKRAERRRSAGSALQFPFTRPRLGQSELIAKIEASLAEMKPLLVQAPTGLGKTVGVLYPALREALGRGQRVVYVTPKNSQHALAEEAAERFQAMGAKLRPLTITAKSKICFQNEPICNPEYCEYAKDHYTKMHEHKVLEKLAKKKKLGARVFRKVAKECGVCPFEIQLDAALDADVVICDYNYVFAPRSAFGRISLSGLDQEGKPNLVIDEAHNLPSRAMDYYSPSLASLSLEKLRSGLRDIPLRFRGEAEELLDISLEIVKSCAPAGSTKPAKIEPPADSFREQEASLKSFLSRYLESDVEIETGDPVLRLCFYWSAFTEALEFVEEGARREFFATFHPDLSGGTVKITCCDASEMLKGAYKNYQQVVGFSATLKPFEYYSRLSGLAGPELLTAEFESPFPKENRKLLIIPQISSKYSERERNYPRIAEAISRIAAQKRGNYFAFFPSFEFLERVLGEFDAPEGFRVLRQERYAPPEAVEELLTELKSGGKPAIVFGVQGGVFSEGVDYPGDMLIGAFVVGPPLPVFSLEREEMRSFYEETFSAGFDYAYTYPAMAKAVQAAGRVIRSERDRGLIVLMDDRFLQPSYVKSMPNGWFREPREAVSNKILQEVAEFWSALK